MIFSSLKDFAMASSFTAGSGRVEHLALAEGELLVALQHEEITEHLGDLEHAAGLDLLVYSR
jgi:hypothetical protein